jgi:hypothetical protein
MNILHLKCELKLTHPNDLLLFICDLLTYSKAGCCIYSRFGIGIGSKVGGTTLGSVGIGFFVGLSNTNGINKTGAVGTGFFVGNFTTIIGFFVGKLRRIGFIIICLVGVFVGFFVGFFVGTFSAGGAGSILIGLDTIEVGGKANVDIHNDIIKKAVKETNRLIGLLLRCMLLITKS